MSPIKQLVPGGAKYRVRRLLEYIQASLMRGDSVECLCCGGKFRKFLPAGVALRPNARCPKCGSLERHRLVWLYVQRQTNLFTAPHRVLDVAPEEILQQKLRKLPNLDYLSIDLESPLAMKKMDLTKLELPTGSYDVVFCNHVFEHIPNDQAAMRELRRVLKPTGWAILQTPIDLQRATTDEDPSITDPRELLRRFGQADHVRIYGLDFFDRLRDAGWTVDRRRFIDSLTADEVRHYALDPHEEIFFGRPTL